MTELQELTEQVRETCIAYALDSDEEITDFSTIANERAYEVTVNRYAQSPNELKAYIDIIDEYDGPSWNDNDWETLGIVHEHYSGDMAGAIECAAATTVRCNVLDQLDELGVTDDE